MERLLLNLVDNAIKFTPAGGTIVVSVIAGRPTPRNSSVRDTGIGMAPDVVPHVFERFYRADSARSSQVDGAGLGLSLVRWIADQHGAKVDVEPAGPGTAAHSPSRCRSARSIPVWRIRHRVAAAARRRPLRPGPEPGPEDFKQS